jgi:hypothetical protein
LSNWTDAHRRMSFLIVALSPFFIYPPRYLLTDVPIFRVTNFA